ncbi:MAG: exodeoxyribonuclease VII large subunit [Candidatus Omnitrophica bacterium]|nr:exodeoxyribonuclease VII large subunit [Candidatus Omnitrophota bacterium]
MQGVKSNSTSAGKKIYTISELTKEIRFSLEGSFSSIWVEGEVSNFIRHSSGHCYLSLKDAESVLACVIFKDAADALSFKIEDGMKLVCFGRISVYNKRGQYQLYIEQAQPKGIGALQLAFEQLKNKLKKEGLFDAEHKKPLPLLPSRIGVVTSPTGAAIRDILNIIDRRFPNMHIILYPVKVQGGGAKEDIKEAIEVFNRLNNVDVLIVGRGGGSMEDLWAFNEEIVARAIYNSKIPVISAVGHEIDFTIADFVADLRAPTPSAAAEIVAGKKQDFLDNIENLKQRLKIVLLSQKDSVEQKLKSLRERYAFKQPKILIQQYHQRLDEIAKSINQGIGHILRKKEMQTLAARGRLTALNPSAILKRGYSITTRISDGTIIKDESAIKDGDLIKTKLAKGSIISKVTDG